MNEAARIGRNNKSRGRKFENWVADYLGWHRVPMSGRIKQFPGDVVDGVLGGPGFWCGECKTQQPGAKDNISVTEKAIRQMYRASIDSDRFPVLFIRNVGSEQNWVVVPHDPTWEFVFGKKVRVIELMWRTKNRGKGRSFTIQGTWIQAATFVCADSWVAHVTVYEKNPINGKNISGIYYFMPIQNFRDLIVKHGFFRESLHPGADTE